MRAVLGLGLLGRQGRPQAGRGKPHHAAPNDTYATMKWKNVSYSTWGPAGSL